MIAVHELSDQRKGKQRASSGLIEVKLVQSERWHISVKAKYICDRSKHFKLKVHQDILDTKK